MAKSLLKAQNLYHIYRAKQDQASVVALKGVGFEISQGESVAIVGPSGSGKSTLLRVLGGLMRPTAGSVIFNEEFDITKTSEEDLTFFRRHEVGFVFQEGNLLPDLSAYDNVVQSMTLAEVPYEFRKKRALELLDTMGVLPRKNQLATRLSGGERQRVAIARAMANNPRIIIADEPTGNVDFKTSVRLLELFKQLNRDTGMAFLFATHSNHVAGYANRSIELRDGLFLGQHGKDIDLSSLDLSRMVIMDSDNRITLPENIMGQLKEVGSLWNISVVESKKILLTPLEAIAEEQVPIQDSFEQRECPVCGIMNPPEGKFCISCGAKF
ncbi:ATP-binding cassette domain-containing protein [Candidatus Hodarchaeum mangrovi]